MALRQPANGQAWGAGDPPRRSAGAAAAASHRCTMSGQLECCEREWHEMEGQFQELQVGPGHLVPQLCYLRRIASPSCSPGPGGGHRQGPGGVPGQTLGAGGPRGPAPSHVPALQFFIVLERPAGAPFPPPSPRVRAPRPSLAAESWSVASEGKFLACPCGGGPKGQVYAGTQNSPAPTSAGGFSNPTLTHWVWAAQLRLRSGRAPPPSQLCSGKCAWETFTLNPWAFLRNWGPPSSVFGVPVSAPASLALPQAEFGVVDDICQF